MTLEPWENPELWGQLKSFFHTAMELPEAERARYVDEVCGDDRDLREALQRLISTTGESTSPVDRPLFDFRDLFPDSRNAFAEGELVLGRFRIVRPIGSGGMGEVYEAIDLELGQHIALKTIRADITDNPEMLGHFKKEVKLAQRVSSSHICRIHELYVLADSPDGQRRAFLTMEFLNGVTLADRIRESGPLPWKEVKTIALEICEGLRAMHDAGIIHRDLKSRNVMLADRNGAVKAVVMDFGLAHEMRTATSETATSVSEEHGVVGTVEYMAPEQFEGQTLTPASDIFALGVVMYESATGKHPFPSRTILEAAVQRGRRPLAPSSIRKKLPHRCDEIVGHCLEFDPKKRYQSAKIVSEQIKDSLPAKLRRTWLRAVAVLFALIVLISGLMLVPSIRERVQGILFSSREKHIAVLPFEVVGNDPQTQALGDGLMDSLAGRLSNLDTVNQSLWVVPASEVRKYKVADPTEALRALGATIVVQGSFERSGPEAHLKLTLIDPKRMREIGYADVENVTGDLGVLADEAVTRMGRLMNITLKEDLIQRGDGAMTRAAYEDYLLALGYIQRFDKPGNLDLAVSSLRAALDADPGFALASARLAQVYVLRYDLDKNPSWLGDAKNYADKAMDLNHRIPLAHVAFAQVLKRTGHYDIATQEFQEALDLDPRNVDAITGLAAVQRDLGHNWEAEAAYVKAASLRPDDWSGYNNLGSFYNATGRFHEAIIQFNRAIQVAPDNFGIYANLGSAYMSSGALSEAEEAFKKSISLKKNYEALANLGNLYGIQHRFSESAFYTKEALKLNDQDYDVWNNLVEAYEWLGDEVNAISARKKTTELLERAIKLNQQDADAIATLAVLSAKAGLRKEAEEKIQRALSLSPNSESVLSDAADVYEVLGDRQRAIQYLEQAIVKGLSPEELNSDPYIRQVIVDPEFSHKITISVLSYREFHDVNGALPRHHALMKGSQNETY